MRGRGFEDTHAAYLHVVPSKLVGQFRRFGEAGAAYEITGVETDDKARIKVVCSGEELVYPVAEIVSDPMAETVP